MKAQRYRLILGGHHLTGTKRQFSSMLSSVDWEVFKSMLRDLGTFTGIGGKYNESFYQLDKL